MIALSAKNKAGYADGSITQPAVNSPQASQRRQCNDMEISWLLNALSKDIGESVLYCQTASELWNDLNERFGKVNGAKMYQIQEDLISLGQGTLNIASYHTKAKKVWDEMSCLAVLPSCTCSKCTCNVPQKLRKFHEDQKVIQFLMGLNESDTTVRGNILMMSPLPSLAQVYSLLIQEEKQRDMSNHTTTFMVKLDPTMLLVLKLEVLRIELIQEGRICFVIFTRGNDIQRIGALRNMDFQIMDHHILQLEIQEGLQVPKIGNLLQILLLKSALTKNRIWETLSKLNP